MLYRGSLWLFRLLPARPQGSGVSCTSNVKNLVAALEMYASDNSGYYPTTWSKLTAGNYLKLIPKCPAAGTDSYSVSYKFTTARRGRNGLILGGSDTFSFHCHGYNHKKAGARPNHPAYDSVSGLEEQ